MSNWNYIEIPDTVLISRYEGIEIELPDNKRKVSRLQELYPWAHQENMKRLFLLCRTFSSKKQTIEWIKNNLQVAIMPIHLSLLETFCNLENKTTGSIDELINNSDDSTLLAFIQIALDRSLLWHDPAFSYQSEFIYILWEANKRLKTGIIHPLKWVNDPKLDGVDFLPTQGYVHVFYKYENLVKGIKKGELYYDIKYLAKQAHLTLLKSMSIFFERSYKLTFFNEENWERQFSKISEKESEWCKVQIQNVLK